MQDVPKIVRERLKAASPPVEHPDADLLTAFAEQSLSERERTTVLEHLSHCGDCREVVTLALPQAEAAETVRVHVRAGWFAWPALRWGFVAAGIVAIASFGVLQYQRSTRPELMLSKSVPRPESPSTEAKTETKTEAENQIPSAPVSQVHTSSAETGQAADKPSGHEARERAVTSPATVGLVAPNLTVSKKMAQSAPRPQSAIGTSILPSRRFGGPNANTTSQQQNQFPVQQAFNATPAGPSRKQTAALSLAPVPPPPVPLLPSSQAVTVAASGAASAVNTAADQLSTDSADFGRVGKAKSPVDVEAATAATTETASATSPQELPVSQGSGSIDGRAVNQLITLESAPLALWTISSSGILRRSFDRGRTWQDVDVAATLSDLTLAAAKSSFAKEKEKDVEPGSPKASLAPLVFRAVSASGADVWAGGSAGVLYHSFDAGTHWARVQPSSAGAVLAGDIVSLEFADPQHGKITTSIPEVWTTSDDGQTWQKQ